MTAVDTYVETRMRRLELELLQAEARIRALLADLTAIDPDYVESGR